MSNTAYAFRRSPEFVCPPERCKGHAGWRDALPEDNDGRVLREASGAGAAWAVVLAGLLGAGAVAGRMQPEGHLSANKVLAIATLWVMVTAAAGTGAMGVASVFLRRKRGRRFRVEMLEATAAWVLLPPLFLLAGRDSAWAMALAAGAAGVMAACLRGMIPVTPVAEQAWQPAGPQFAELPAPDSGRGQAWAVAICVECAVLLAARRQLLPATLLMGVGAGLFVWKQLTSLVRARGETMARPAARSVATAVLALLVVVPLLLVQLVEMRPPRGLPRNDSRRFRGSRRTAIGASFCMRCGTRRRNCRRCRWNGIRYGMGRGNGW